MIDLLGDLLENLFVPSEEKINGIINIIKNKFNFIESIKIAANSLFDIIKNVGNSPKLTVNVNKTKYTDSQSLTVLDLSWYAPYKPYGDLVLTGFIYAMFIWRFIISIPNIINGSGGFFQSDYQVSDIQAYSKFGFGRSSSLNLRQDNKTGGVYRK